MQERLASYQGWKGSSVRGALMCLTQPGAACLAVLEMHSGCASARSLHVDQVLAADACELQADTPAQV